MNIEISDKEKALLLSLENGISSVKVYKWGLNPTVVSFVLQNGRTVTLRTREVGVAHWFEVFPMTISESELNETPDLEIDGSHFSTAKGITILSKSEWTLPLSDKDKEQLLGDTNGATEQTEGLESEIPSNALNHATFHAGVEICRKSDSPFIVASSIAPFALYVTDCDFSEPVNGKIYDRA